MTLDGRQVTVPKATTVLEASLCIGIHIPTFCWHPKLKPVGACRMCYVEIEKFPKLQVSCATECTDGMIVHTDSNQVKQGRKAVIEFLLINHPLDCPTCDKGGECDLQNLTFAHGYDDSRFDFVKRRHITDGVASTFDDVRIGPEIILNRNRCILCYKCVRSNKEAFGEFDLGAYERGNHTEIHAAPGEQVDNPFSGNLVEICPVGALTNTDWRYKIRVWLTRQVPSIDPFDSSGTNTLLYRDPHKDKIYRTTSRRNDLIDDGWLADVTRYGYQIAQSPDRLQTPLIKKDGKQVPATWDEALAIIGKRMKEIGDSKGNVCIGGLIGPQLDCATQYSFSKFMRTVVGSNNIDFRIDYKNLGVPKYAAYAVLATRPFSIAEIDTSDVIFVLGSDLVKEHPNEYLRVRKASNFHGSKIYTANSFGVKSADVANLELIYQPGTEEVFVNGLCLAAIEEKVAVAPDAATLASKIAPSTLGECAAICGVTSADLRSLAKSLATGKKISVLVGEQISQSRERSAIAAALCNLNRLLGLDDRGQIAILARYANSRGAEKAGLQPEPHPAIKKELSALWNTFPDAAPHGTEGMLEQVSKGDLSGMVVLGANPVMMYPDRKFAEDALEKLEFLVVADIFETDTTTLADVVLPLASWTEYAADYVNLEGRVQRAERVIKPQYAAKPGHEVIASMAQAMGQKLFNSDSQRESELRRLLSIDTTVPWPSEWMEVRPTPIAPDKEYPFVLVTGDDPHHRGYLTEKSQSLAAFSSEAYAEISAEVAEQLGVLDGDSMRIESRQGKAVLPVRVSPWMDGDVVFVPRNFSATQINALVDRKARVDRVKLQKATR
ncbi:MAG: NADH-quinone oxidoreductase subunit NuoG [candidate division Zixibacteria bacterium]|nr:NADH-quinone oxidoreductase subunit NuoG [candidate division Zixibacteria bacterium]